MAGTGYRPYGVRWDRLPQSELVEDRSNREGAPPYAPSAVQRIWDSTGGNIATSATSIYDYLSADRRGNAPLGRDAGYNDINTRYAPPPPPPPREVPFDTDTLSDGPVPMNTGYDQYLDSNQGYDEVGFDENYESGAPSYDEAGFEEDEPGYEYTEDPRQYSNPVEQSSYDEAGFEYEEEPQQASYSEGDYEPEGYAEGGEVEEDDWEPYVDPPDEPVRYAQSAVGTGTMTDESPEQAAPKDDWTPYVDPPDAPAEPEQPSPGPSMTDTGDVWSGQEAPKAPPVAAKSQDDWEPYVEPDTPLGTVARKLAHNVLPTAAGIAAAAVTAPAGPWVALPAGIAAFWGVSEMQERGLAAAGRSDADIQRANRRANPKADIAGDVVSAAIPFGIGSKISGVQRGVGAVVGGTMEGVGQVREGHFDPVRLAAGVATGGAFAAPRSGTQQFERAVGGAAGRVTGRPDWYAPPAPPPPNQSGVKNQDWTGPPADIQAPMPPEQGQMPFGQKGTPLPPEAPVPMTPKDWARRADIAERWETATPQERAEYGALTQKAEQAAAAKPDRPQIGGGETQPGLPFDQPAPPPKRPDRNTQPELELEPPPTVGQQGELGLTINAPDIASRHAATTASPDSMPGAAGTAKEMPPPRAANWPEVPEGARPKEPQPYPHSAVGEGMAQEAAGAVPRAAAGIHVLQPGQMDPTVQHGLRVRTEQPATPKPQTTFEPPRPPEQGPPAPPSGEPIPRNRSLAPLPPKYTQGKTEPPVPGDHTRMYQGERQPPNMFTTERAVAERYGPVKSVDVSNKQGMPFFTPGREAGTFTTRNNIYRTRARPVGEVVTEPLTKGGQPAGGAAAPRDTPAAPPGLEPTLANRLLNQPALLRQEAAKRGMPPEALKAQAQAVLKAKVASPELEAQLTQAATKATTPEPGAAPAPPSVKPTTAQIKKDLAARGFSKEAIKGMSKETAQLTWISGKTATGKGAGPAKEVTLAVTKDGRELKGTYSEKLTVREALARYGTMQGLLDELTPSIRGWVEKAIGRMPVYIVSERELLKFGAANFYGRYEGVKHQIILNEKYAGSPKIMAETALHEAVHGVTSMALRVDPALRSAVKSIMFDVGGKKTAEMYNAFKNEREFIAEAFSNPVFQKMLREHELSPHVAKRLQAYFDTKVPVNSAWDALVQSVRRALGVPENKISALEAVMRTTQHAMDINVASQKAWLAPHGIKAPPNYSDAMPAPSGKASVTGRDKFGNEIGFTGQTVHAAAARAKAAGYRDVFLKDGTPYTAPKAAAPEAAAPAAPAAVPPGGGGPPAGGSPPAGGTPQTPASRPASSVEAARESILSHVAEKPSWYSKLPKTKEEAKQLWRDFYTATKNGLDPFDQAKKLDTRTLTPEEDFAKLAHLTRGLVGRVKQQIKNGTYDIKTGKVNGKGLDDILKPIEADIKGFTAYALSKRVIELEGRNIKTGMNVAEARQVVAADTAKFEPVFRDLVGFQNRVLDNMVKTGILSHEAAAKMRQLNKEYVPFYRMLDPKSELGQQLGAGFQTRQPIHKIKGSEKDVLDPITSIIKNTYLFTDLAHRNQAMVAMRDFNNSLPADKQFMKRDRSSHPIEVTEPELQAWMNKHGIEGFADEAMTIFRPNAFRPDNETIRLYSNGKSEVYKVPERLAKAVNALDVDAQALWLKIVSTPAKMLRTGAVLSPEFMLRNPFRDTIVAFIQATHGSLPVHSFYVGMKEIFKNSKDYQEWMIGGGANANLVSMDRSILSTNARNVDVANKIMNPKQWYKMLQDVSEFSENATRVGMYVAARKKGVHQLEAAYASREGTLDFARQGSHPAMRALNSMVPFLNVHIEGLDRAARAFRDDKVGFLARSALSITTPSVALWFYNKDNERVDQLPAWQKDLFWIIPTDKWVPMTDADAARFAGRDLSKLQNTVRKGPNGWERNDGTIYRVPKPFELGVVFGSVPERILDAYYKDKPNAFKSLDKTLERALIPNYVPQAALPFVEQFANRSLFLDRTLLTEQQQKLPPAQQFGPHTSETAKELGKIVRGIVGDKSSFGSPVIIDNYIRQWSGGLGKHATDLIDAGIKKIDPNSPPAPSMSMADMPGIKAFVARFPGSGAQAIQDFYDQRNERKMEQAGIKEQRKTDAPGAQERMQKSSPWTGDPIAKILKADRDAVIRITKDKTMSPDDKRAAIDLVYLLMIEHAKQGTESMERSKRK